MRAGARGMVAVAVLVGAVALARGDELPGAGAAPREALQPTKAPPPRPAGEDAKPLDRSEIDRRVARVVFDAAKTGATMYNSGNHEGCFRLYEGTLRAVAPMIDHHPKLAEFVRDRLTKCENMKAAEGAFELRKAIDLVQQVTGAAFFEKDGKGDKVEKKDAAKPLWERMGGEKVAKAVVHDFVAAVTKDPKLDLTRGGKFKLGDKEVEQVEKTMLAIFGNITSGPRTEVEDQTPALAALKITEAEYRAMQSHLAAVLQKHKVPPPEIDEVIDLTLKAKPFIVVK